METPEGREFRLQVEQGRDTDYRVLHALTAENRLRAVLEFTEEHPVPSALIYLRYVREQGRADFRTIVDRCEDAEKIAHAKFLVDVLCEHPEDPARHTRAPIYQAALP